MSGSPDAGGQPATPANDVQTPTAGAEQQAPADDKTETAAPSEEADIAPPKGETWPEGTPDWAKDEIRKLRTKARRASARAERATAEADRVRSSLASQPQQRAETATQEDPKRPRIEDFKSYEDYEAADRKWIADDTRANTLRDWERKQKEEKAKTEAEAERKRVTAARERFDEAAEAVAEDYDGFDEFLEELNAGRTLLRDLDRDALEIIFEHDNPKTGVALAFRLHSNPDELKRIASLSRAKQVAELARLEASLPKPRSQTTQAPPPPRRVNARGGADGKDPEKMSIEELRAATKTSKIVSY